MRTKEIRLRTFEELSKEEQDKVIEKNYNINTELDWYEGLDEGWVEDLAEKDIGATQDHFTFSLDRGANFGVDSEVFKDHISQKYPTEVLEIETSQKIGYFHQEFPSDCWKKTYGFKLFFEDDISKSKQAEIQKYATEIFEFLTDFAEKSFDGLQKHFQYLMSEESIKETIIANEYEFNDDLEID